MKHEVFSANICVVVLQSNEAIFQACLSQLTPAAQAALSSVLSTWSTTCVIDFDCRRFFCTCPLSPCFTVLISFVTSMF